MSEFETLRFNSYMTCHMPKIRFMFTRLGYETDPTFIELLWYLISATASRGWARIVLNSGSAHAASSWKHRVRVLSIASARGGVIVVFTFFNINILVKSIYNISTNCILIQYIIIYAYFDFDYFSYNWHNAKHMRVLSIIFEYLYNVVVARVYINYYI